MSVEEIIIHYLVEQNVPGIEDRVYMERPEEREDTYVLVRRAGGSERDFIRDYIIYTDTCVRRDEENGLTKALAMALHESVVETMKRLPDSTSLYRCRKYSDYESTMTDTKEYRFQVMWSISM